jgi:hypothetical protein
MILAAINPERFVHIVHNEPVIAFQAFKEGCAVGAPGEAYYAPLIHKGGGNLDETFVPELGLAFLARMSQPRLRTLRPTAKPTLTNGLSVRLRAFGTGDPMDHWDKLSGDEQEVADYRCQVVNLAIEEHDRPDLKAALNTLKRDAMLEASELCTESLQRVIMELNEPEPAMSRIRLHLTMTASSLKNALGLLLEP